MDYGITLTGEIKGIRTTPDGGWAITVECGQDQVKQVALLSNYRGKMLEVAFVPHPEAAPEDPLERMGRL